MLRSNLPKPLSVEAAFALEADLWCLLLPFLPECDTGFATFSSISIESYLNSLTILMMDLLSIYF